ncbi:MAG: phosphoribosyltransferase [Candidatus Micrarchaeota archaeon]|nr:phosphoribosyltransferase [Candidatus Micrarchaeota archaeon]
MEEDGSQFYNRAIFSDRREAGKLLAKRVKELKPKDPIVLAIPRGGIVIGYEIAKSLGAELDIVAPRKLRDPWDSELAIGSVMPDGSMFLNDKVISLRPVPDDYIAKEREIQTNEAQRRLSAYRGGRPYPKLKGRSVILVDDGIATGSTMESAASWVKGQGAAQIIIAVPVMPEDIFYELKKEVDDVIYLALPDMFFAIGQFYREFPQVADEEVVELLNGYWSKKD